MPIFHNNECSKVIYDHKSAYYETKISKNWQLLQYFKWTFQAFPIWCLFNRFPWFSHVSATSRCQAVPRGPHRYLLMCDSLLFYPAWLVWSYILFTRGWQIFSWLGLSSWLALQGRAETCAIDAENQISGPDFVLEFGDIDVGLAGCQSQMWWREIILLALAS